MRGASALATYLGRTLMGVGLLLIFLSWNGSASFDSLPQQFPFLLSGAIPGLALIIVGAGLEYVQSLRRFTAKRAKQMAELNVGVVQLVATLREHGGITPAPDTEEAPEAGAAAGPGLAAVDTAGSAFAPQGQAAPAAAATATATSPADEMVVAGRSSFHRPDCHLVVGRDDMTTFTRLEGEAQGLAPCKVCKP